MKKISPLTKKRRSLAELAPDSLASALCHRELAALDARVREKQMLRETGRESQNEQRQQKDTL